MSRRQKPRTSNTKNNTLRIIAGKWRGRKVPFPDGEGLRPTSDRIRETLFNWLAPVINGANCLDLFSGSGALSLEALSRGAAQATLLDANNQATRQLQKNLTDLECSNAQVITTNSLKWLQEKQTGENRFDVVFLDPPFNQQLLAPTCELLEEKQLIAEESYIYIETEASLALQIPDNWRILREKKAGQVAYYLCARDATS